MLYPQVFKPEELSPIFPTTSIPHEELSPQLFQHEEMYHKYSDMMNRLHKYSHMSNCHPDEVLGGSS